MIKPAAKPAAAAATSEAPKPVAPNPEAHLDALHTLMGERLSLNLKEWAAVNRSVEIIRAALAK